MKKKKESKPTLKKFMILCGWKILLGIVIFGVLLLWVSNSYILNSTPEFKITQESCWNESQEHTLLLEAKRRHYETDYYIPINEKTKIEVQAYSGEIDAEKLIEDMCIDYLHEKEIYVSNIDLSFKEWGMDTFIDIMHSPYDFIESGASLDGITCKYETEVESGDYYEVRNREELSLDGFHIYIPEQNESKVIKGYDEHWDEYYIDNSDSYWTYDLLIINPEVENCKQVEVEEVTLKKEVLVLGLPSKDSPKVTITDNCGSSISFEINVEEEQDLSFLNEICSDVYGLSFEEGSCFNFTEITKKDLTTEWLDENAHTCYHDEKWFGSWTLGAECDIYKIGDYLVEVIK